MKKTKEIVRKSYLKKLNKIIAGKHFTREEFEKAIRKSYVKKAKRIQKQKPIFIGAIENFRKRYEK